MKIGRHAGAPRVSAPRSDVAAELRMVLGTLVRRLRQEGNLGDLSHSQTNVLRRLERDGAATVTHLARLEGVRPQSMGATVAALSAAGLIDAYCDPADKRQTILALSVACRQWIKQSRAAREDWLHAAIQNHLSAAERARLTDAVDLLKRVAAACCQQAPSQLRADYGPAAAGVRSLLNNDWSISWR